MSPEAEATDWGGQGMEQAWGLGLCLGHVLIVSRNEEKFRSAGASTFEETLSKSAIEQEPEDDETGLSYKAVCFLILFRRASQLHP